MLYFNDPGLRSTLGKIQALLSERGPVDAIYGETLGLTAAIELARLQLRPWRPTSPIAAGLAARRRELVRDYIEENLENEISLSDLAGLVAAEPISFHPFVQDADGSGALSVHLASRIEAAKPCSPGPSKRCCEISGNWGSAIRRGFPRRFESTVGTTPSQYRRDRR